MVRPTPSPANKPTMLWPTIGTYSLPEGPGPAVASPWQPPENAPRQVQTVTRRSAEDMVIFIM